MSSENPQIDWPALVRLSFSEPEAGFRAVQALGLPMVARWMMVALAVVLGVVLAYLLPALTGATEGAFQPFPFAMIQLGFNVLAIWLLANVGRMFGGTGSFADAVLLVGWLQLLMVGLQAVQVVVMLILPPLGAMVLILAIAAFFWLFSGFTCALHGFESRLMVLLGALGTLFAVTFVISFVLIILGIPIPGLEDA